MIIKRNKDGTFVKKLPIWTEESWDSGWVDNHGYFRVFCPDCPNAWPNGYAKRYHVVWWIKTGKKIPKDFDIHHKNNNKTDDRFENLQLISHAEHSKFSAKKPPIIMTCRNCKKQFELSRDHNAPGRGKFCGQKCYHSFPRSEDHKKAISEGIKNCDRYKKL